METDGSGAQVASNVYGTNLISRNAGGELLFYMYNGHADVTSLQTQAGTTAAMYYYDAFGTPTEETGSADNPFRYAGYQFDEETGLYYLKARMYDSINARFMQEDTYRGEYNDPLSLNLYTYCSNNPLIYWDPTGHWQESDKTYDNATQQKIIKATNDYYAATTPEGRKAASDAAEAARKAGKSSGYGTEGNVISLNYISRAGKKGYVTGSEWKSIKKSTREMMSNYGTVLASIDFSKSDTKLTAKDAAFIASFAPGTSTYVDVYTLFAGKTVGTKEKATTLDRAFALGGMLSPLTGAELKTGEKIADKSIDLIKGEKSSEKVVDTVEVAGKAATRMTTKQATIAAKELGYESTNYVAKSGEKVFYNKKTKTYISQDVGSGNGMGSHNGGVWKVAKSPEDLNSKSTRLGTYDANMNRIGD